MSRPVARAVLVAAVFGAALLAQLPLQPFAAQAGRAGVGYREAAGSAWSGTLRGASWQGQPLGDLQVALSPTRLLQGRAVFTLAGAAITLQADCSLAVTQSRECHISVIGDA